MKLRKKLLKLLGHKWKNRFFWGEFDWKGFNPKKWELSLRIADWGKCDERSVFIFSPLVFSLYIDLPKVATYEKMDYGTDKSWGIYIYNESGWKSINFQWGKKFFYWHFPFINYNFEKKEILDFDRNVVWEENFNSRRKERESFNWEENYQKEKAASELVSKEFDYIYQLKSGEIQPRKATIFVDRRTWGRKWASWSKLIRTSINIRFNDEVGERTGSWKGGCIGCSWELLDGEAPEQSLRRMEQQREF